MWQSDGHLVQIEVGSAITKAATHSDRRGIIGKIRGDKAPSLGEILIELTDELQKTIAAQGKIFPPLHYRENNQLASDEVLAYMGLEVDRFKVSNLNDILKYLEHNINLYSSVPQDRKSINQLLSDSLNNLEKDDYQAAFEKLQKAYYWSYLHSYQHELIRCLSDTGSIRLKNADLNLAFALFSRAFDLCESPNIVDTSIKSQVALNTASALRVSEKYESALSYLGQAYKISYSSGDSAHLFLALLGITEVQHYLGNYDKALLALQQSKDLVLSQPSSEKYKIALTLQESITHIYDHFLRESRGAKTSSSKSLLEDFVKIVFSALVESVVGGVVYKLFGVSGSLVISILGTSKYNFDKPIFNAPAAIGDNSSVYIGGGKM